MEEIETGKWKIFHKGETVELVHVTRSGNEIEVIRFTKEEFLKLHNLVLALSYLHPEWLSE